MVFSIAMPAMAVIEDKYPPEWGDENPIATAVWQLDKNVDYYDEEGVEPSCLQGTVDSHLMTFGEDWDWEGGVLYSDGSGLSAVVGVPEGEGGFITCQVTARYDGEPDIEEPGIEIWHEIRESDEFEWLGEFIFEEGEGIEDLGDGYYTMTATFSEDGEDYSIEDITHIGAVLRGSFGMMGIIVDAVIHDGEDPPEGAPRPGCVGEKAPVAIIVDANDVIIYEPVVQYPLDSEGNFTVCLRNEPETGATVTVVIDPNNGGPSEDFTLIGGDPVDGSITLTFTDFTDLSDPNWNEPQVVRFVAVHDEIPEPRSEGMSDPHTILVSSYYPAHPTDANYVGEKAVGVTIIDNDKADILFRVTPMRGGARVPVTGPVQLFEQYTASDLLKWRKIGFQLQVQPAGGPVKLNAVVEEVEDQPGGDNLPLTDPCLPLTDDPNGFTFTSTTSSNGLGTGCPDHDVANRTTCWNVDQDVKIWGNDDEVLQVEAFAEGDQNYQAVLEVTVIDDGGDERYADLAEDDPKTVDKQSISTSRTMNAVPSVSHTWTSAILMPQPIQITKTKMVIRCRIAMWISMT